jgi:hypothetical protein
VSVSGGERGDEAAEAASSPPRASSAPTDDTALRAATSKPSHGHPEARAPAPGFFASALASRLETVMGLLRPDRTLASDHERR